ncbi:MAG: phosphoribosylglycinamide formyltransferase [Lachnospiraceae bacterium]|nr:phosphoribosylglycinamide formyltransferase [Lachnospiraceae bacterium]
MLRVVVCVSGGGTNLQAILDAIGNGSLTDTEIVLVLSNNRNAYALTRAKGAGVRTAVVSRADYADAPLFEQALLETVRAASPDLIVLAGFLVTIPRAMVEAYRMRIINVHPSLIPSFCGTGFYGLKVHEAALARGVKVTGATVHYVDEDMDTGPILLQKAVAVMEDDTPKTLQKRVMEEAEWVILPRAVQMIARGEGL